MFKWSKHRPINDPSRTPFLTSVALPEIAPARMQTWPTQVMGQTTTRSAYHHRSMTPAIRPTHDYTESTRPRTSSMRTPTDQPIKGILKKTKTAETEEKPRPPTRANATSHHLTENQGPRPRSSSNAQTPVKGILKPPKVYPIHPDDFKKAKEKPVIPPTPEPKDRPDIIQQQKALAKKSSVKKGGGYSHLSESENHLENPSSHHDYPERHGRAPSHFYQQPIAAPQPMRANAEPPRVPDAFVPSMNVGYHGNPGHYHHGGQSAHHQPTMMHQAASYPITRAASRPQTLPLQPPHGHGYPHSAQYGGTHPPPVQKPVVHTTSQVERPARRDSSRDRTDSIRTHTRERSSTDAYRGVAPGPDGIAPVVPLSGRPKEEHVSLSWPLVSYELRQQKRQTTPKIYFDLGLGPQVSLKAYLHGMPYTQPLLESDYMQSASSHCHLTEMQMVCAGLERWPFIVRRSSKINCYDVYQQIYENVTKPLTREELASFSPAELHAMQRYFEERVHKTPALDSITRMKGLCRIDVLRSRKMFKEIVRDKTNRRWVVLTEDPVC